VSGAFSTYSAGIRLTNSSIDEASVAVTAATAGFELHQHRDQLPVSA
jgi:hypothetical protein